MHVMCKVLSHSAQAQLSQRATPSLKPSANRLLRPPRHPRSFLLCQPGSPGLCKLMASKGAVHSVAKEPKGSHGAASAAAAVEEVPATAGNGSAGSSSQDESSGGHSLRQEVEQLRSLLQQQAALIAAQQTAQAETAALVKQQAETIAQLEARLTAGQGGAGAGVDTDAEPETETALQEVRWAPPAARGPLNPSITDRRALGSYDSRFHSTDWAATPRDHRILPRRIVLVRHAESEGNVDDTSYTHTPDPKVPLTTRGWEQAMDAGEQLRAIMDADGKPYKIFFYTSPYLRCKQTTEGLVQAFRQDQLLGVQEEVQLREQDFGNFQDAEGKKREKMERMRYGRFFYRFPHGESGADVYDRMTIFEDHLVRDINAGRFGRDSALVLVTHGLAARIFLQRWFHWSVDEFLGVWNPPNATPIVMERVSSDHESRQGGPACWIHTKALYRLTESALEHLVGVSGDMCQTSWLPRGFAAQRKHTTH